MEIIESCLSDIISIIRDNFWQFLIIIALLNNNRYRTYGLLLLFTHLWAGYQSYAYVIVFIIIFLTTIVFTVDAKDYNTSQKEAYERRIKELEDKVKELSNR